MRRGGWKHPGGLALLGSYDEQTTHGCPDLAIQCQHTRLNSARKDAISLFVAGTQQKRAMLFPRSVGEATPRRRVADAPSEWARDSEDYDDHHDSGRCLIHPPIKFRRMSVLILRE